MPVGFGAKYQKYYDLLEPGSKIWVVTRISGEFSLAGVVTIKQLIDRNQIAREDWPADLVGLLRQWRFVAQARREHSAFHETNNAQPVMDELDLSFSQGRTVLY